MAFEFKVGDKIKSRLSGQVFEIKEIYGNAVTIERKTSFNDVIPPIGVTSIATKSLINCAYELYDEKGENNIE